MKTEMEQMEKLIEAELERLDMIGWNDDPCGFVVAADEDLPAGWVRISDEAASFYGEGAGILAALAALDAIRLDRDEIFTAIHSIEGTTRGKPESSGAWPGDLLGELIALEEGAANGHPMAVRAFKTNGGELWAVGASGAFFCPIADTFAAGGEFYDSREEAEAAGLAVIESRGRGSQ